MLAIRRPVHNVSDTSVVLLTGVDRPRCDPRARPHVVGASIRRHTEAGRLPSEVAGPYARDGHVWAGVNGPTTIRPA